MIRNSVGILFLNLLTVGSLGQDAGEDDTPVVKMYSPAFLIDLKSTDITYDLLSDAPFTYIVLDPDLNTISTDQLTDLKKAGKIILAYLSVGEAEMGRDYWTSEWTPGVFPRFLEHVNPFSRDRYKVRFWQPDWQSTLTKYLRNHIVRRGYSGVYLDGVDVYAYFLSGRQRPSAPNDMVALAATLRRTARLIDPDFLQFTNNAAELYGSSRDYGEVIDGVVSENVWYEDEVAVSPQQTNFTLQFLRRARTDGKTVLVADFPLSQESICDFYIKCTTEVFRCAVFDKRLNGAGRNCR